MGRLVDGKWSTEWYSPDEEGRFVRSETRFRDAIRADDSTRFRPEAGRYHLYVSLACPWAHRTLIVRALMGLEEAITVSVVSPKMGDDGWAFEDWPGATRDDVLGSRFLRDVYRAADAGYTGRVTVPILWDRTEQTIVNNESREIIRMFATDLGDLATRSVRLIDAAPLAEIDAAIDAIYEPVNNGVYRAGFATTQRAYDEAVIELFEALDHWNGVLERQAFVCGEAPTEADVCLFTTLLRFDAVYHGHFKCNLRRIADYPGLQRFLRAMYAIEGVAATCDFDHIKTHYYWSHPTVNPTRIVPRGPVLDL